MEGVRIFTKWSAHSCWWPCVLHHPSCQVMHSWEFQSTSCFHLRSLGFVDMDQVSTHLSITLGALLAYSICGCICGQNLCCKNIFHFVELFLTRCKAYIYVLDGMSTLWVQTSKSSTLLRILSKEHPCTDSPHVVECTVLETLLPTPSMPSFIWHSCSQRVLSSPRPGLKFLDRQHVMLPGSSRYWSLKS